MGTEVEFKLTTPPMERQRARYEKELDEAPRYILVANNRLLTLEVNLHYLLPTNLFYAFNFK